MNLIQKIQYLGVTDKMPVYEQKSTILFNQIIRILAFLVVIGSLLMYIFMDYKIVPLMFLSTLPVIGIGLFLNLKSKVKISVVIISVFFPVFFVALSVFAKLNGETNVFIFYLAPRFGIILISIICYIIMGLQHPRKAIFSLLYGAIIYIFYDKIHALFGIKPTDFEFTPWDYKFLIFEIGGISTAFVLLSTFLQLINSKYEKIVTNQNTRLKEKNEEIIQQNEEIEKQRDYVVEQKEKIEHQNKEITDSIVYASRIQKAILGNIEEVTEKLKNSFILFKPHSIVSGDFYWFTEVETEAKSYKIIIAADCTGHGVPGAFMTVMGHDLLDEIIEKQKIINPSEILKKLDFHILQKLKKSTDNQVNDGMDISILVFDSQDKKVLFGGAKNPLYYVRNNEINIIKGSKCAIGGNDFKNKTFEEHEILLQNNDIFYIFSDGFQDQFGGEKNQKYMTKIFREFLFSISNQEISEQKYLLENEFMNWKKDNKQTDDVLIIGIKFIFD
jgi:serine phosphatase RsbU (regulator of sigma subunit)